MELTSQMIKEKAKQLGIDAVGIADIGRFSEAPALMNPANYFPGAKSVIVVLMRIPRGSYRGIEEGTHWHNYTFYSYNRLNSQFRPRLSYALSCFIEDHGYEAVPHYPAVPERSPTREPVAPGKLPGDIICNIRLLGVGAGLGEMGHAKVFLNKCFGPRVRLGCILTDAVLEPDPIVEPGSICTRCGRCVRECPGGAVPPVNGEKITVNIGGRAISWGNVHMGKCTLTHHGMNNVASPFLKKDMPNLELDVANTEITEEEAYRICYPLAGAQWTNTVYDQGDSSILKYYHYVKSHTGYFAVCGAKGCIRACMDQLEKTGRIENTFKNKFYKKPSWKISYQKEKQAGAINPYREAYLDEHYPGIRAGEQQKI